MANSFNFSQVASLMQGVEKNFLIKGVELARDEMIWNIQNQQSKESGKSYPPLTYLIDWVPKNPPRLVLTGELFEEIKNNPVKIIGKYGVLTIDPIDEKGRGYASYHQEGENQYKDKDEFQAEFVTQSKELDLKQRNLLISELDKVFR